MCVNSFNVVGDNREHKRFIIPIKGFNETKMKKILKKLMRDYKSELSLSGNFMLPTNESKDKQ